MKKSYENYIIYGLLALVIFVLIFAVYGFSKTTDVTGRGTSINNEVGNTGKTFKSINSGGTGPGDVSVELTPHELKEGVLEVDYVSNTHSVDLSSVNLKSATTLIANGKEYKPIEAPILRGHHNRGTISFEIDNLPTSFTIKIKGIPNIEERVFTWQI